MSKRTGKELTLPDRRWKYLIEMADECHIVPNGYRLRFTRSNTTLLLVMGAIDSNPAHRFQMTMDETGACWVDVQMPHQSWPRQHQAAVTRKVSGAPVVA